MSMFGIVFPDPHRQERIGMLLAAIAYEVNGTEEIAAYVKPITDLRVRDAWVETSPDGPPVLALYTRNGGGNRDCTCEEGQPGTCTGCLGDKATEHPAYLRDADDEFDSTYRTYWFEFPDSLPGYFKKALNDVAEDPRNMSEMWLAAIDTIGSER